MARLGVYLSTTGLLKGRTGGGREVLRPAMTAYQRACDPPGSVGAEPLPRRRDKPSLPTADTGHIFPSGDTER